MIRIGKRNIGRGEPCFITAEAGPTHNGLEMAKRLVKHAADAGADAIKFQIFDADRLVADREMPFSYKILTHKNPDVYAEKTEPLYQILKRRCMDRAEWLELKAYSDSLGLSFFATVLSVEDIRLIQEMACDSIKIASGDVNNFPLIREAAKTGLLIQLDTGSSTIGEVEAAVDVMLNEGNENIIIHQCPSGYPARLPSINLKMIETLRSMFDFPIAFSDHSPGWDMDIAALAMGADMIEKTITEDRLTPEVEHCFSLEPADFRRFVEVIREVEVALGSGRRRLSEQEKIERKKVRRCAWLLEDGQAGQRLGDLKVEFRRPENGIPPDLFDQMKNRRLRVHVPAGRRLSWSHLEDE